MLSIITITKNDNEGLKRTIGSTRLLRMEWDHIEQIIVDGSSEETASLNELLCANESQVRYYKRQANGISDAFNFGIQMAKFKWCWFLNGGDQLIETMDLSLFRSLLVSLNADVVIFQVQLRQRGTVVKFPSIHKTFPPVQPWIPHPATIVKRDIFTRYGDFIEKYKIAMDYELWLRLYGKKLIFNLISLPLTCYDENGISSKQLFQVSLEGREVLWKYRSKLLKFWITNAKSILKQYRVFNRSMNENRPNK